MSDFDKGYLLGMGEAMVSQKQDDKKRKKVNYMNTFKNYGCPKGAPGAMGVDYAQLEKTISFAMHQSWRKEKRSCLAGNQSHQR